MPIHHFDAVIVGSGATGGWAAKTLAEHGLNVLLLEAGPLFEHVRDRYSPREFLSRKKVQSQLPLCTESTQQLFVDDLENPYTTPEDHPFLWIRSRQVGGRMRVWGRVCLRMSDFEFKAASRDGYGLDWPISYADLQPYYDKVEAFMEVAGTQENLPQLPDGQYTRSPALDSYGYVKLSKIVNMCWPDRRLIPSRVALSGPEKMLTSAMATGRLALQANAVVSHITIDRATGNAKGIAFVDRTTKRIHEVSARIVLLCASTIESTRILLNSAPGGLGNSSGVLGRYLMDHTLVSALGVMPDVISGEDWHSLGGRCYVPRFRNLADVSADFIRGYGIDCNLDLRLPTNGSTTPSYEAGFWFGAMGEMLPRSDNCVTLNADVKDAWGIPVANIDCSHGENDRRMVSDQICVLKELISKAGFRITQQYSSAAERAGALEVPELPGAAIHEVGTARMGSDPKTSVVNEFNQSWDIKNLFVTDGACFVTSGWQNPTLTMMAITARACDHIVSELKKYNL